MERSCERRGSVGGSPAIRRVPRICGEPVRCQPATVSESGLVGASRDGSPSPRNPAELLSPRLRIASRETDHVLSRQGITCVYGSGDVGGAARAHSRRPASDLCAPALPRARQQKREGGEFPSPRCVDVRRDSGTGTLTSSPDGAIQGQRCAVIGPRGPGAHDDDRDRLRRRVQGWVSSAPREVEPDRRSPSRSRPTRPTKTDTKTFVIKPRAIIPGVHPGPLMRSSALVDFLTSIAWHCRPEGQAAPPPTGGVTGLRSARIYRVINKSERAGEFAYGREAWTYECERRTGHSRASDACNTRSKMPTVIGPRGPRPNDDRDRLRRASARRRHRLLAR